jgi:flavorubredoxin
MADNIAKGLRLSGNLNIDLVDLENIQLGELESKILKNNALIIGSPTINQNTLLPVYKLFSVINPIRDKGKLAAVFGSYGWSGEAVKIVEDILKNLKLKIAHDALSAKFHPHNGTAEQFVQFGKKIGEQILEKAMKLNEED